MAFGQFGAMTQDQLKTLIAYICSLDDLEIFPSLSFCLIKEENPKHRSRGATKFNVLVAIPWLGAGGIFWLAHTNGALLSLKLTGIGNFCTKISSGAKWAGVATQVCFNLSDLAQSVEPECEAIKSNYLAKAIGDKLSAELPKRVAMLENWGINLELGELSQEPIPPNLLWWEDVNFMAGLPCAIQYKDENDEIQAQCNAINKKSIGDVLKSSPYSRRGAKSETKKADYIQKAVIQQQVLETETALLAGLSGGLASFYNVGGFSAIGESDEE